MPPTWIVCAWTPIIWQASCTPELRLEHLDTRVLQPASNDGYVCRGHTLWAAPLRDGRAGLAWDWVEIDQGVVAMADPFGLVTNLKLVGACGEALSDIESVMRLNAFVHTLPWQREVHRQLRASASA